MTDPVLVIVGEWECGDNGEWDFSVEKNIMAQTVMMTPTLTYRELQQQIRSEFGLKPGELDANISYWMPNELSTVTQSKAPPVCIKSDNGLIGFRKAREGRKWVTMFVSFSSCGVIDINAEPFRGKYNLNKELSSDGTSGRWEMGTFSLRDSTPSSAYGISPTPGNLFIEEPCTQTESTKKMTYRGKGKALCFVSDSDDGNAVVNLDDSSSSEDSDYSDAWQNYINSEAEALRLQHHQSVACQASSPRDLLHLDIGSTSQSNVAVVPVLGEPSDLVPPTIPLNADLEFLNGNLGLDTNNDAMVPHITEPYAAVSEDQVPQGCDEYNSNDDDMDDDRTAYEVQCTLTNLYADIKQGEVLPPIDAPAVFDDGYVLTGKEAPVEFDNTDDSIYIGRIFKNKAEMQIILAIHAIKRLFTFRQPNSDKTRLIVKCTDKKCPWRVYGVVIGGLSESIEIRTATLYHTCDVTTRSQYGKKASAKVIAFVLKSKFANGRIGPRACDIPDIVHDELRVSITYMMAWYAKEKAVANARGSEESSYKLLRGYMMLLTKANPGTVYRLQPDITESGERRFKYLFFSLGASIAALPYLRKVIIIDGTAIKAKFQGCMLTASLQDGNFRVFPLVFGVVDGENEPAWTWFLSQLSTIIPDSKDLMFMSDRHSSIYAALQKVYPLAHHGACSVHLYRNVKARFRGEGLGYLVSRAARSYSVGEFRYWFAEIEKRSGVCATYLRKIGFPHWTSAYSPGMRYNISSTNIAETLNSTLSKALQFPIISMVECIRMMLMQWFYWRRTKAAKSDTVLTPEVDKLLLTHLDASSTHTVIRGGEWMFQINTAKGITYTVNLLNRTCTCRLFEKLGLPCSHAIAAARVCGIPIPTMAEPVYKHNFLFKTYESEIYPVPSMEDEEVQEPHVDDAIVKPKTKRGSGRPPTKRIPSIGEGENKRRRTGRNKCSRCFEPGHNRKTCRNALP